MRDEYKKILVTVDGSDHAKEAVHEAIAIAKRNETSLTILHVKDETRVSGSPYALAQTLEELEQESQAIIADIKRLVADQVEYDFQYYAGNPKKEIVKFSKDFEMDLIVIGSNSKGLLDRMLVGSTTTYVINHAPCNVMVVK
ncbi:universal stress protein [Lactococcus kimchii]|uniref:universal stress protein n=1 Tax=Lactococcus sp. S-13 TaxID=2507158 RepID=UPI0010238F34|nr:universal stress protein [Lactococcus sp. S-13]RZI48483.1 universal stress protein [Lactococcus sp. S-13]